MMVAAPGRCVMQLQFVRLFFLLVLISLSACGGGDDGGGALVFEETELFSCELPAGNHTQLTVEAVNGEITITGESDADSVMITAIKRVQSKIDAQDAKDHLQELVVNCESLENTVFVETIQPDDTVDRNYIVDYTITLPTYFMVQVDSINGIVTLDSIENDVTVNMVNGEVTLSNIHGGALVGLANGTIDSEVVLPLQGTIDLKVATGGDIQLAIPTNTSATFSATTLFGVINISSNLVLQDVVETSTSLSGTLGSGDGEISLGTMGDIYVSGF